MSIAVVIPTLNCWQFLDECLTSVAAQTDQNWEAIVINDGSDKPDTAGVREKWSDKPFTWIDHENTRGPGAARNSGIRATKCELVFTLDSDDLLHPLCLERLRQILDDPDIDCAFPDFEFFGSESRLHRFEDADIGHLAKYQFIPAQVLMRKSLWKRVNGYWENPVLRGNEDWDFWLSAAELKFRYFHLHDPLYRYRVHEGGLSKSRLIREDYRTRELMYRRHRDLIDNHSNRRDFLGSGYWRSAAAYCKRGCLVKSLALGLRAFSLQPNMPFARDLVRRNLSRAFSHEYGF